MSFRGEDDAHAYVGGRMNMMVEIIQKMMLMKLGGERGRGCHEGEADWVDDEVEDEDDGDLIRMTGMVRVMRTKGWKG